MDDNNPNFGQDFNYSPLDDFSFSQFCEHQPMNFLSEYTDEELLEEPSFPSPLPSPVPQPKEEVQERKMYKSSGLAKTRPQSFMKADSPIVPNPDLSYDVIETPPPPPPVNKNPPFPPPYENCNFYQFRDIDDARHFYRRLNNHEECWVAIPSTFLHRIVENPSNPIFGYILHK